MAVVKLCHVWLAVGGDLFVLRWLSWCCMVVVVVKLCHVWLAVGGDLFVLRWLRMAFLTTAVLFLVHVVGAGADA